MAHSKTTNLMLRIAIVALLAVFVMQAFAFGRHVYWNWGSTDLIWYEFSYTGLSALTVLTMVVLIRFSKIVVATMSALFAIAGLKDILLYEWADYMRTDLRWAIPFAIAAVALTVTIVFENRLKTETS